MLESKIDELFLTINESKEYQEYLEIKNKLEQNKEINDLINKIKKLQQEATLLESKNDLKYLDLDKETENLVNILNNNTLYQEYLQKMKKLNNILSKSSGMIEDYINGKI